MITGTPVEVDEEIQTEPGTIASPQRKATQPARAESMGERRAVIERRLAELKHERAVAAVDGREFKRQADIRNLTEDLEVLVDAEGEATRRAREAAEAERERRRAAVRVEISEIEERRLEAIRIAESATLELMIALRDIQTFSEKQAGLMQSLGARVWDCAGGTVRDRMSVRISKVMKPVMHSHAKYGEISFADPGDRPAKDWDEDEQNITARELSQALQPSSNQ